MLLNYCPFRTIKEITETLSLFANPKGILLFSSNLALKKRGPALTVGIHAIPGTGLGVLLEDYEGRKVLYGNGSSARVRRALLRGGPFLGG